ncbi:MAG: VRR-NUC domain-containing protein [Deltaproteobacteria bacterium]|jgi:hypothetical protein|nr:VRR-NUC domain-containing protein [Deltaproteobacteria bacterium]
MTISESSIQIAFVEWIRQHPKADLENFRYHSIPNGGYRNIRTAVKLKAEGVEEGVPDLFFAAGRHGFNGLYIEMKKPGGRLSKEQKEYIRGLMANNFKVVVCDNVLQASTVIRDYYGYQEDLK